MAANSISRDTILRYLIKTEGSKELRELASNLDQLSEGGSEAATHVQQLVDEFAKLQTTAKSISQFAKVKASLTETGASIEAAREKLVALQLEFNQTDAPTKKLSASLERARREFQSLLTQQGRQTAELARTGNALRAAGVDVEKLATAERDLGQRMTDTRAEIQRSLAGLANLARSSDAAAASMKRTSRETQDYSTSLDKIGASFTKVSALATAATAAITGFGVGNFLGGALDSARSLERELSEVRAVTGASADQLERLKATAEAAAKTTIFTAQEAANGLGVLARATGDAEAAIAALPASLNLAQASGMDLASAATVVATTLVQFQLPLKDSARVADVLAKAANSTNASVQDLGLSLSYVAPLAKQLGLGLEDTVSILGALADQGFRGERAATALRNVMSGLLDPSNKFRVAIDNLGIKTNDFSKIIEELAAKGAEGKQALLAIDTEARPAISALVASAGRDIRSLSSDLGQLDNDAARTAAEMAKNFDGAAKRFDASFDNIRRSLVEPFLGPLTEEVSDLAVAVDDFSKTKAFEELKTQLLGLVSEGTAAIREFLENTDFDALTNEIASSIAETKRNVGQLIQTFGEIAKGAEIAFDAVRLAFNAVQTIAAAAVLALSEVMKQAAKAADALKPAWQRAAEGLLEAAGVVEEGSLDIQNNLGLIEDVSRRAMEETRRQLDDTTEAFNDLVGGSKDAGTAAASASGNVGELGKKVVDITEAANAAAGALRLADEAMAKTGETAATAAEKTDGAAQSLLEAFDKLGISSQQTLNVAATEAEKHFQTIAEAAQRGAASQDDVRRAFEAYEKAVLDSVKNAEPAIRKQTEAMLAQKAAALGMVASEQSLGEQRVSSNERAAESIDQVTKQQLQQIANNAELSASQKEIARDTLALEQGYTKAGTAAMKYADDSENSMASAAAGVADLIQKLNQHFAAVSEKARQLFVFYEKLGVKGESSLRGVVKAILGAAETTQRVIDTQKKALEGAINNMERIAATGQMAGENSAAAFDHATQRLQALELAAKRGSGAFAILSQQDLDRLAASVERARAKMEQLRDEALAARAELADLSASFQDELDQLRGDEKAIEDRNFRERLKQLEELAKKGGYETAQEYANARRNAEEVHKLKLKQIADEARARAQTDAEDLRRDQERANGAGPSSRSGGQARDNQSQAGSGNRGGIQLGGGGSNGGPGSPFGNRPLGVIQLQLGGETLEVAAPAEDLEGFLQHVRRSRSSSTIPGG